MVHRDSLYEPATKKANMLKSEVKDKKAQTSG